MSSVTSESAPSREWFCLRSQPKHEHIAAGHLRQLVGVEVFLPRIRFKRATVRGAVWTTEALFPGYLFARFQWPTELRRVQHERGVAGVVHFGDRWPVIAESIITELRTALGEAELHTVNDAVTPGEIVRIAEGSLRGSFAVVARVRSGRQRVAVLMEFLGRQTMVEFPASALVRAGDERSKIL